MITIYCCLSLICCNKVTTPPMTGYVTPMASQMGGPMGGMGVKHPGEGGSEDEPSNKKLRNEDSLIPEEVFLARNTVNKLTC